jgi:hypothetical protein
VKFVDERAAAAPDAALIETRNRAPVRVPAYSGGRGAEVLSHTKDDREGRNGFRWENVDFDAGTMLIFGKNQTWERTSLPSKCLPAVRDFHGALDPDDGQWPVFPSGHSPSLYDKARAELGDRFDQLLADDQGDIWQLFRTQNISPPPLTTAGARSVMKRLTDGADLEVDGEYLKLHGGRRGLGDLLYRIDRGVRSQYSLYSAPYCWWSHGSSANGIETNQTATAAPTSTTEGEALATTIPLVMHNRKTIWGLRVHR